MKSIFLSGVTKKPVSIESQIEYLLVALSDLLETEVPDFGRFEEVEVCLKNESAALEIGLIKFRVNALFCKKDTLRRLELVASDIYLHYETCQFIEEGSREYLLKRIRSKEFALEIENKLYDQSFRYIEDG